MHCRSGWVLSQISEASATPSKSRAEGATIVMNVIHLAPSHVDSANPDNQAYDPLLTLSEIASELRCSKAHASKIINGKVRSISALPSIRIGRRPVVRRSTFEKWKADCETVGESCYSLDARDSRVKRMGEKHA